MIYVIYILSRWRFNVNAKREGKKRSMTGRNAVLIKYCSRPIRLFNRNRFFEAENLHLLFRVHPVTCLYIDVNIRRIIILFVKAWSFRDR